MGVEKQTLDQLKIDRGPDQKSGALFWGGTVIVILLVSMFLVWFFVFRAEGIPVTTAVAKSVSGGGQRTVLNASGYVTARRDATVSSKVTGKIVEVLVEEGMTVKKDQVLARLDVSNIDANLQLAEARLKVAHTALKETEVRLKEAQLELNRVAKLVTDEIQTEADLDAAEASVDSYKAILLRQTDEITVAERQILLWKQELDDRVIRAPFDGVVISKDAQPGEMISPVSAGGGFTRTGICTIVDMESLEIEVDVSESYINRVRSGQPVQATLDSYTDWKIPCKVIAIIPTADRQKATVKVRIGFDELDSRILPDMGVKVAFQDATTEDRPVRKSVVIPIKAAREEAGKEVVWVVRNGVVERRAITLGDEDVDTVTVLAGIEAGERVVVKGHAALTDGAMVVETQQ